MMMIKPNAQLSVGYEATFTVKSSESLRQRAWLLKDVRITSGEGNASLMKPIVAKIIGDSVTAATNNTVAYVQRTQSR